MNHLIANGIGRRKAHSPSPFPLPPVGHPCLSSHWGATDRPLMDARLRREVIA